MNNKTRRVIEGIMEDKNTDDAYKEVLKKIDLANIRTEDGLYQSSRLLSVGDVVIDCRGCRALIRDVKQRNYLPKFLLQYKDGTSKWRGKTKIRYKVVGLQNAPVRL